MESMPYLFLPLFHLADGATVRREADPTKLNKRIVNLTARIFHGQART
jgi:hypothetical protein